MTRPKQNLRYPKNRNTDSVSPAVVDLLEDMAPDQAALVAQVRDVALEMSGVEERTLYDGFCREWTPAYYMGKRQLFHVHSFSSGLRATVFLGLADWDSAIMEAFGVPLRLREQVASTAGGRGVRQVKVPLSSTEEVEAFLGLVRAKWELLQAELSGKARATRKKTIG